jgi:hypothetical protein
MSTSSSIGEGMIVAPLSASLIRPPVAGAVLRPAFAELTARNPAKRLAATGAPRVGVR